MKAIAWIAVAFTGLFFVGIALITPEEQPKKTTWEKISEGCETEFGSIGREQVDRCKIAVSAKLIEQSNQDKLDRAYRSAR